MVVTHKAGSVIVKDESLTAIVRIEAGSTGCCPYASSFLLHDCACGWKFVWRGGHEKSEIPQARFLSEGQGRREER